MTGTTKERQARKTMSGFLDRAKNAAQQGVAAGKQKVGDVQVQRAGADLLKKLGTAVYAEQRQGGSPEAVEAALGALDAHVREHGDASLR
jgi:hypothetical protein